MCWCVRARCAVCRMLFEAGCPPWFPHAGLQPRLSLGIVQEGREISWLPSCLPPAVLCSLGWELSAPVPGNSSVSSSYQQRAAGLSLSACIDLAGGCDGRRSVCGLPRESLGADGLSSSHVTPPRWPQGRRPAALLLHSCSFTRHQKLWRGDFYRLHRQHAPKIWLSLSYHMSLATSFS